MNGIRRDPHNPKKIQVRQALTAMQDWAVLDATPELESMLHAVELQAGMSTSLPLREHATLAAYDQAHPEGRTMQALAQWLTRHQVPSREAIAIDIEAQAEGKPFQAMTFQPGQRAMTFKPGMAEGDEDEDEQQRGMTFRPGTMADAMPPDPLDRMAVPMTEQEDDFDDDDSRYTEVADGDIDHMKVSPSTSLRQLQRAGLLKRHMSPAQVHARLKRAGMDDHDAGRRGIAASLAGFFQAQSAPAPDHMDVPYSAPTSAQGDTLPVRADDSPMKGLVPRVVNLQGRVDTDRAATLRALHVDVDLLQARKGGKERTC